MSGKGFTHLHLHSQYSLLDGAITFEKLFDRCHALAMTSVAVTDHGNMFGAVEFYTKALAAGIKPIIGIEAYIAPGSRLDKQKSSIKDAAYHLVLLAENNKGYANLLKLASIGYTEGFYYRPRIDKEILAELNEGLICSTACISGEIATALEAGDEAAAQNAVEYYLKIFGPNRFFIEIQHHDSDDSPAVRQALIDLAQKNGLGVIATNDAHFLNAEDHEAHNALCCINTGKKVTDETRLQYPKSVYLKSPDEMRELFAHIPQACDLTLDIAARCNVEIDLKARHAPTYHPADGSSPEETLKKLCAEGAKKRYGKITPEVKARLDRELEVIQSKGFASYFLIVWDFCKYATENNIPVGARGSGVGTLVGYCLGLCNVDPIRYDLLFERFMDPERNEMPDIDIDICQDGRAKVIDYVRHKYGHVAQIITFGTMKARAVIRDVCRVLDVPLSEADRLAKLIQGTNTTLEEAVEAEPDLKKAYEQDEQTRKVIDIGKKLEGLARHASVHAAGVVVADEPLTNFVPLYKASGTDDIVTQFEGPMVEKIGLLKMDFLGLRTLSVLERAKELAENIHNVKIDLEKIDLNDPKVFELFGAGKTKGVFQFESAGMQDLLMRLKPDRIEDLIAANALYRPGPMTLIGDYIDRKHGAKWTVPHLIMKEVLQETYGIMVYQEQVMRICNRLGDIPLRQAYTLIKAISKKKADTIAKEKQRFITGCTQKGLSEKQADEIFELIERFAGYGFNKSHSTRYAFIAYQTAYLKTYWPTEFMAALLTYEMSFIEKVVEYIAECKAMGIEVLGPDINESFTDFTVVYEEDRSHRSDKGVIRFGLAAVKGVGEKAVEQIIAARQQAGKFHSLFHFCENTDLRAVNKQVLEALIKAGAFDKAGGGSRAQMMIALEKAMQTGQRTQADKASGQLTFFSAAAVPASEEPKLDHQLPNVPPWPEPQLLAYEKEVLGFFITSNPLSKYAETIETYSTCDTSNLPDIRDGQEVILGGMVTKIRHIVTRNGRNAGSKMAVFTLEDLHGTCEVVLFPDALSQFADLLAVDKILFVRGKLDSTREIPNVLANDVVSIDRAPEVLSAKVKIRLLAKDISEEKVTQIKNICAYHKGKSPLVVTVITDKGKISLLADRTLNIRPDKEFCKKMALLVGAENFELAR